MGFATIPLLAITTGLGALASASAARRQNAAISQSQSAAREGAVVQRQQIADSAALEKEKRRRDAQFVESRSRVLNAQRGIGANSGTALAISRQSDLDLLTNRAIISQQADNQLARASSGFQADFSALEGGRQNALLSGFTGALGGMESGLAITGLFDSLGQLQNTPEPQQQFHRRPFQKL